MGVSGIRTYLASFIAVILLAITFSVPGPSAETVLEADRLEITPDKTLARGNVRFSRSGFVVSSKTLQLLNTGEKRNLSASGEVTLTSGRVKVEATQLNGKMPEVNQGDRLRLRLDYGSGSIESVNFAAEKITITVKKGTVTDLKLEGEAKLDTTRETELAAERIKMVKRESSWELQAAGSVKYSGRRSQLSSDHLTGTLESRDREGSLQLKEVSAEKLSGQLSTGERKNDLAGFSFTGEAGRFTFDDSGELTEIELSESSLTSCEFCRGKEKPAYSFQARQTSLFPGEFLVTRSSKLESFGFPVWATPNYFVPLKDFGLPNRSYFPRTGFSAGGGLNFEGAVPFYLNRSNFGNLRADFSTKNRTIGVGLDYYSGGNVLNGVGELYGNVRNGEVNFLTAEAQLGYEPVKWLQFTGKVDYQEGPSQGEIYDRNEWSLSLNGPKESSWSAVVSRVETEEDSNSSNGSKRVLKKLPEVSYFLENLTGKHLPETRFGGKLGYYDEYKPNWVEQRTGFRGKLLGDFSLGSTPLDWLELSLTGLGRIDGYFTENNPGTRTRLGFEFTPRLELKGPGNLTIKFEHRSGLGSSPFVFDRIEDRDRLSFSYRGASNNLNGELNFHYDFLPPDGISNLNYEMAFDIGPIDQEIGFKYDLSSGLAEEITTNTVLSHQYGRLELESGYDFSSRTINESELTLELARKDSSGSLKLTGPGTGNWVKELSTNLKVTALAAWTFQLGGKYDFQNNRLSEFSYSINKTLQNCLRIGISGTLDGLWFNTELTGF